MFQDPVLQEHLETTSTIQSQALITAEWNMNYPENLYVIGNYRYRPQEADSIYNSLLNSFDVNDEGYFYTNATNADIVIDGGIEDTGDVPITFISNKIKEKLLYSLEDCFGKFRPRSGINKARYFDNKYINHPNINMSLRPRYYMADKNDKFKYWTSFRTETVYKYTYSEDNLIRYGAKETFVDNDVFKTVRNGEFFTNVERGIAHRQTGIDNIYYIDDAAPFVVYKEKVPANRIIVKMQTNVGSINLGPFSTLVGEIDDPLFGDENKTVPQQWRIQYLDNNNWVDAITFDQNSLRNNNRAILSEDGYLELAYGLIIPEQYFNIFTHIGQFYNELSLPDTAIDGYAYLIKTSETDIGYYKIWFNNTWETFVPRYDWYLAEEGTVQKTSYVNDLVNPEQYINPIDGSLKYKEFQYLQGIRVVAETMTKFESTFDLIEMSPRLVVNLTEKVIDLSVTKVGSDIGLTGMPVGQLLASTGSLSLFDYDQSFLSSNPNSIIAQYTAKNIQIKIFEVISNVGGYDYYVPIKTLYSETFPEINNKDRQVRLNLRDLFFYFESLTAPQTLIQDASVSYAIALLLDSVGFSNYVFRRNEDEQDPVIPFFFIGPDKTVAQVLNDIAISTQTAMFFDEYNNFVMMSKNYIMPTLEERETDLILYGSKDFNKNNLVKNNPTQTNLANIIELSSQNNSVFNDGKIVYSTRSIQRSYSSVRQASMIDQNKTWIYKPVLLWEVAANDVTKSQNDEVSKQSSYSLSAIPLNSDLSSDVPTVVNNQIINNTIDFGEAVYWLSRYNGYFYANGEVIRYDAVEYSVLGNATLNTIWISSVQEYQNYFSKLPFNGKMYPTGLVRIYAEPNYETVNEVTRFRNGAVAKHGRGQFGTEVVSHSAGLNQYWSNNDYVRGVTMQTNYLFSTTGTPGDTLATVNVEEGPAGLLRENNVETSNNVARQTSRNGIIKNFLSNSFISEANITRLYSTQAGTVQSSALVMTGPSFPNTQTPIGLVSYVYKSLPSKFKHFGTRLRIIGKINDSSPSSQTPVGTSNYYSVIGNIPSQTSVIGGASAGLAIMINPETNNGYYFEIIAITENNINDYVDSANVNNVIFYKVMKDANSDKAIPIPLWSGFSSIIVDDGLLTGQYRMTGETNPSVYDLSVEYEDIGSIRRFYLYINNNIIATVDDPQPLKIHNNMALFIRGSAKAMFENIYALNNNYESNGIFEIDTPLNSVFGDTEISVNEAFRKYAMSGAVQSTYLTGISANTTPKFKMYFDEFGTIMREAAYFNVRYDKAYPALAAKLSPTFNRIKGYTVSGFTAGSYGAEFLIFNATDTALNLDSSSGNYLRIQGVTFTQQSSNELTVDDYFSKKSDFSDPEYSPSGLIESPIKSKQDFYDIKTSRMNYGKKEFTLDTPYIQTQDDAKDLMAWIISKIMKPRKSVGVSVFGLPILQLGDIVEIDYQNDEYDIAFQTVANSGTRFVVYNIDYKYSSTGPSSTIYLSEVL